VGGDLGQLDTLLGAPLVEQAQLDRLGRLGEHPEAGSVTIPRRSQARTFWFWHASSGWAARDRHTGTTHGIGVARDVHPSEVVDGLAGKPDPLPPGRINAPIALPYHFGVDPLRHGHHQRRGRRAQAGAQLGCIQQPAGEHHRLPDTDLRVPEHLASVDSNPQPHPSGRIDGLVVAVQAAGQLRQQRIQQPPLGDLGADRHQPAISGVLQVAVPRTDPGHAERIGEQPSQLLMQHELDRSGTLDAAEPLNVDREDAAVLGLGRHRAPLLALGRHRPAPATRPGTLPPT
jgi:hypothetical protein